MLGFEMLPAVSGLLGMSDPAGRLEQVHHTWVRLGNIQDNLTKAHIALREHLGYSKGGKG